MTKNDMPIKKRGAPRKRDVAKKAASLIVKGNFKTVKEVAHKLLSEHYGQQWISTLSTEERENLPTYRRFRDYIFEELGKTDKYNRPLAVWYELGKRTHNRNKQSPHRERQRAALREELLAPIARPDKKDD